MKPWACLLLAGASLQGSVIYEGRDETLRVSNVATVTASSRTDQYLFKADGNPVVVESFKQGLKITAPHMEGAIAPKNQAAGITEHIKELHATAPTLVHFDSQIAYETQRSLAEREKTPPPAKPVSHDVLDLKTERMDYTGDAATGSFVMPGPFELTANSTGVTLAKQKDKTIQKQFVQNTLFQGVSGTFAVNPAAKKKEFPLKSGTIQGPLTFNLERKETQEGVALPEIVRMSGRADKAIIDLEKTNTVTLVGNVTLAGENGAFDAKSTNVDTVVVTFDETMNPILVEMKGKPAVDTVREKRGGGRK